MDNHPKPVLNYPERVKTVLFGIIFEMSKTPWLFAKKALSDFSRKRKLDFENLLRFLISMQSGTIAHELLKHFNYSLDTLSNSAFYQQRKKLLIFALQYLLRQFNSQFPLELYKGKYNLVASDGCEFNIARNPNDPSTFHPPNGKSTKGFNMLHTISFYDILSKRYLDCETQPGRLKNEFKAFCELVDRYPYEGAPIFIADRGFASYNVFAHVKEKGALFMIRAKDVNVRRLLALETLPNNLNEYVEIILSRIKSIKKWKCPDLAKQYRYIDSSTSFDYIKPGSNDEYHLSLRIVRFEVADGIFENIITNLPADEFSADEIKKLYNMRWNIETSFRDLKHTIGTSNFHSKKVEYIEQEIWARLILFNFCSIITTHVVIEQNDTKYVYQVNFAMAMKICHHFIRLHEYEAPPYVEALIGSYSLPIRLNRNFARQHRFRLPASFCYRFS